VELINFIFRLGVVFAIYGFLWGIIKIGYNLLRATSPISIFEEYILKTIQYFILVDVTFIFGFHNELNTNQLIITGFILLTYFIGKLQNQQNKTILFQMVTNGIPKKETKFDLKAEIIVITMSITVFIGFIFFPQYAKNPISEWFYESILNIEDTPVFGFIFKVIGFIFIINMFLKMINGLSQLISGKAYFETGNKYKKNEKEENNDFDDFEEIE
jgi:hypothetical protein